ncbi:MAG: NAD(P)H-quinone oxidoreductase [Acidimicrobiia bacterium]
MRSVIAPGDGTLRIEDRPDPEPRAGEVRVRIHGAGINRADLLQRAGFYPAPPGSPPDIPGLEFAGAVDAVGDGVGAPGVGDRVFGVTGGGTQSELVVVPAVHCAAVPEGLDLVTAGGIPEVFITAHDAMRTRGRLQPGEHVLVHAVGSGVGTAVVQLAKAFGCTVTGTARTESKLGPARELGMDHGIVAPRELEPLAFSQAIVEHGGAPDVVVDLVGGPYVTAEVTAIAPRGRIVVVGTLAGGMPAVPLLGLMQKRAEMHGTVLRPRSIADKAAATAAFVAEVVPMLADGRVRPIVDRVFPIDRVEDAYALVETDTTFGKVILDCG